jgi:PPOX class probable F420-dependent enzyme
VTARPCLDRTGLESGISPLPLPRPVASATDIQETLVDNDCQVSDNLLWVGAAPLGARLGRGRVLEEAFLPSRRDDIRMDVAEQTAFLDGHPFGVLGTIGPSGCPHLVNIGFTLDGQGAVVMSSFRRAQKVRNVERLPQASLLVEATAPYSEIRGVLISGAAEVVTDREQVAHWYLRTKNRSARILGPDNLPTIDDEQVMSKRVLIVLSVDNVVSWDHRKLGGIY